MKKFISSFLLIFLFIIYAFFQRRSTFAIGQQINQTSVNNTTTPQSSSQPASSSTSNQPVSSTGSATSGKFKNGTYTGDSVDAYYGNIQVKVVVSNGKISDLQFLDYPQDRSRSMMINSQAMPILKSEAIKAQSADVRIVSGATMTSDAFIQSLQSALSKAV